MKRFLYALAVAAGGVVPFASADEPKPKPAQAEGVKKPAPADGVKKPGTRTAGRVGQVNVDAKSFTIIRKGDGSVREDEYKLAADAVVLVDGKPGKFEALKAEMNVEAATAGEGKPVTELRITGQKFTGLVRAVTADSLTIVGKPEDRTVKLAAGGKVMIQGKEGKLTDLAEGAKVFVQLSTNDSGALLVSDGFTPGGDKPKPKPGVKPEGDKPKVKPEKPGEK
jgi:hypothetical protein